MRPARAFAVGLVAALAGVGAVSAAGPVDRLLRRSGLDAQLAAIPDLMRVTLLENVAGQSDPRRVHEVLALAGRAFDPARLRESVRRDLSRLDRETRAAALAFLSSRSGQRVTRAEVAAASGQAAAREGAESETLAGGIAPARRRILERLELAAAEAERRLELDERLSAALVEGVRRARPELVPPAETEPAAPQPAGAGVIESYRRAAVADAAWVYREVPDADLARYAEFVESRAGQVYQSAIAAAVQAALEQAARRFGELLAGERSA